jgi:AraC-like DNA-binding protein
MIIVLAGRIQTHIAGKVLVAGEGEAMFYPVGTPHAEVSLGEVPLRTFCLSWPSETTPAQQTLPLHGVDRDGRLVMLAKWMSELCPPRGKAEQSMLECLLQAAIFEYARGAAGRENEMVLQVRRFAQANLSRPISLDELAGHVGLSRFHFARSFGAAAGESPMRFIRRIRVDAARTLLLTTPLPLKTIATHVGFADQYHLSHVFRKMTGSNPRQFRMKTLRHDDMMAGLAP